MLSISKRLQDRAAVQKDTAAPSVRSGSLSMSGIETVDIAPDIKHDDLLIMSSALSLHKTSAKQSHNKLVSYSSDAESVCGHDSFVADYGDEVEEIDESWIPTG